MMRRSTPSMPIRGTVMERRFVSSRRQVLAGGRGALTAVALANCANAPTVLRTAMRNWGQDRLVADPLAVNIARYRITEAAIEHSLGEKVKGVFKPDRREKFLIRVAADLEIHQGDDTLIRSVSAKSWGEESILVDEKPHARRLAIDSLVRRVMAGFDREKETAIRANMADLAF